MVTQQDYVKAVDAVLKHVESDAPSTRYNGVEVYTRSALIEAVRNAIPDEPEIAPTVVLELRRSGLIGRARLTSRMVDGERKSTWVFRVNVDALKAEHAKLFGC